MTISNVRDNIDKDLIEPQIKVLKQPRNGPLVKRFNTHAFHACIHGFESHTGHHFGGLAQLGEHLPYKQGVGGSNPSSSTIREVFIPK